MEPWVSSRWSGTAGQRRTKHGQWWPRMLLVSTHLVSFHISFGPFAVCFYWIWRIRNGLWYYLKSPYYNYLLGILSFFCVAEPLFRMVMGLSITNLNGQKGLAPFELQSVFLD